MKVVYSKYPISCCLWYLNLCPIYFLYSLAFFTQDDVNNGRKRWVKAICQSLQSTKPQCPDLSDRDLAYFLMDKTDSFLQAALDEPFSRKCAARVTGLQQPPTWLDEENRQRKIWVLNGDVQLDEHGTPIEAKDSPYIWLGDICAARPELFQPDSASGQHLIADPTTKSNVMLPLDDGAAAGLIDILDRYYAHNLPAALLVVGGFILAVHYEILIEKFKAVPATIAYGQVQCGKTRATRAALSLMGITSTNFFSDVSDSRAFEFTSQSTLGMVIDDPEDLKQIGKKLTYHFQKSNASTRIYNYQPRTTFLTSMNEKMLKKVSAHSR